MIIRDAITKNTKFISTANKQNNSTKVDRANPFGNAALDYEYRMVAKRLMENGARNATQAFDDAYDVMLRFGNLALRSYDAGVPTAKQNISAARKDLEKNVTEKIYGYKVQDLDEKGVADLYKQSVTLPRQKAQAQYGQKTPEDLIRLAAGDDILNEKSQQAEFYSNLPSILEADMSGGEMTDAQRRMLNQLVDTWTDEEWATYEDAYMAGTFTDEQREFYTKMGQQKARELGLNAEYEPWKMGEWETWLEDYYRKNTLAGAQEWAEAEPLNSHAQDNYYFLRNLRDEENYVIDPEKAKFNPDLPFDPVYYAVNDENVKAETQTGPYSGLLTGLITGPINQFRKNNADVPFLTEAEKQKFNSKYGSGTEEEKKNAYAYLDYIKYRKNALMNDVQVAGAAALADKDRPDLPVNPDAPWYMQLGTKAINSADGLTQSIASIAGSTWRGFGVPGQIIQRQENIQNAQAGNMDAYRPLDKNNPYAAAGRAADAARQQVMLDHDWNLFGRDIFDDIYGAAMSTADSLVTSAVGTAFAGNPAAGQAVAAFLMGNNSAQSAMDEADKRGMNDDQKLLIGVIFGGLESATEAFSLGKFYKSKDATAHLNVGKRMLDVLANMGINASEEAANSIGQKVTDYFIGGNKSEYATKRAEYERLGVENPHRKALEDLAMDVVEDAYSGGIQGFIMGTTANVAGAYKQASDSKSAGQSIISAEHQQQLKELGMAYGQGTEVYALAKKYNAQKANARETGRLFRAISEATPREMQGPINTMMLEDIQAALMAKGETDNIQMVAQGILGLFKDEDMAPEVYQALAQSQHGLEVAKEMLGANEADQQKETGRQEGDYAPWEEQPTTKTKEAAVETAAPDITGHVGEEKAPEQETGEKKYFQPIPALPQVEKEINIIDREKAAQFAQGLEGLIDEAQEQALSNRELAEKVVQRLNDSMQARRDLAREQALEDGRAETRTQRKEAQMAEGLETAAAENAMAVERGRMQARRDLAREQALEDGRAETRTQRKEAQMAEDLETAAAENAMAVERGRMLARRDLARERALEDGREETRTQRKDAQMAEGLETAAAENAMAVERGRMLAENGAELVAGIESIIEWGRREGLDGKALAERITQRMMDNARENRETREEAEKAIRMLAETMARNSNKRETAAAEDISREEINDIITGEASRGAPGYTDIVPDFRVNDDGNIEVRVDDQAVPLEDAPIPEEEKEIIQEGSGMSRGALDVLMNAYQEYKKKMPAPLPEGEVDEDSLTATEFARGFKRVMQAVMDGLDDAGLYADQIGDNARAIARRLGEALARKNAQRVSQNTAKIAAETGLKVLQGKDGGNLTQETGVRLGGIAQKISDTVKKQMQILDWFGKKHGIQFRIYDSITKDNVNANGTYRRGGNIVNLSLNAQEGLITKAASHEVGHYIKHWNPEAYKELQALVLSSLEDADGYDLNTRIQDMQETYRRAGIELNVEDAKEEITNDGLLDFIATEQNVMEMAAGNPSLLQKIRDSLNKIMRTIREAIDRIAKTSPEVEALKRDHAYLQKRAAMIESALNKAREQTQAAMNGAYGAAAKHEIVKEYRYEYGKAVSLADRQAALNGLAARIFMQTQKAWLERNRNADIDLSLKEFRGALLRYGKGEAFVATALEKAGFIAPAEGSENMLLSAYLGQQEAMMEGERDGETEENAANAEDVKYSLMEDNITNEDVNNLRLIGRNSINEFTSDDMQATQKWAKKFYKELGTKSPFFRAWFGDWRENDISTRIKYIPVNSDFADISNIPRGDFVNADTNWNITVSRDGIDETANKKNKSSSEYRALTDIDAMIRNAVLLDTIVVSNPSKKMGYSAVLVHHLYCPVLIGNEKAIAKIYITENYDGNHKFYLTKIEKVSSAMVSSSKLGEIDPRVKDTTDNTEISVAEIFDFVKKNDVKFEADSKQPVYFTPRKSSEAVDDNGKPALFYHGTPNGTFYTFKDWQYFTSNKEYADVYQEQGASSNGYKKTADNPKTYAVYLQTGKIFDTRRKKEREIFQREFYGKWGNGAPLSERGLPDWTDGDDLIEFFEENGYEYDTILLDEGGTGGYGEEVRDRGISYVIRDSSQIKSADENIGTFDKNNPDIRYSLQPLTESIPDVGEDAELSAQVATDKDAKAALQMVQKLYSMATQGKGYLGDVVGDAAIQPEEWKNRLQDVAEKLKKETGTDYSDKYIRNSLSKIFTAMDKGESLGDILMYARDFGKRMLKRTPGMVAEKDPTIREAQRILKDSRFFLTDDMKSEIRETYGSLQAYMRKNFGKLGIRSKATASRSGARMSLSEVWQDLSSLMPGTFPADATEADMPGIVDAFLETAGQKDFGGAYGKNIGAFSTDLGLSVMLEYFSLPGAIGQESNLRRQFENKLYQMRVTERQKYEDRLTTRKQQEEKRKAMEGMIREIGSDVKYLNARIVRESNANHVPEELKGAVIQAMGPFLNNTSVFDAKMLGKLREAYSALMEDGANADTMAARAADEDILRMIGEVEKTINGRRLSQLNQEELQSVRDIMGNLKKMVTEANDVLVNGRKEAADRLGNEELLDVLEKKDVKAEKIQNLTYKNTIPIRFFRRIGGVFQRMYEDIRSGQGQWAKWTKAAREYADRMIEKYQINDWLKDSDTLRFTTDRGEEIELDKHLALSLYATWKREITNTVQNANHLRLGGFMYPKGMKAYEGVDMHRPHALTSMDMLKIQQYLGKTGMEFADAMVDYLSNEMAAIGNEVSMSLYGYRKFTEKYYFPYQSSSDFLNRDLTKGDVSMEDASGALKNWGAAKKLQTKANNPIVIGNFMDVWSGHVNKMAIYGAFTVPVDNMNRLYNYKTPVDSDMSPTSIRQEMNRVYGAGAERYIATLMRDIAGGVRAQDRTGAGKLISKFKKGATAANLQVVVQQYSSLARAMAVMNPRYLAFTPPDHRQDIAEMREHSGLAIIKEMGRFDTGTGISAVQWLQEGIQDESMLKRIGQKLDKAAGFLAEKADLITWSKIWRAVKREIADTTDLAAGTQEYWDAVTRRFEEVIDLTQVYDSTLSKSELMRSNSTFDKMTTSFMAEPTVTFNMLQDAFVHVKEMGGKRKLLRATSVWMSAAMFNAILKSIISATRRKDDEERTYLEKYAAEVWGNFTGDLNPMGMVPIARDIVSLLEGYDVQRADMEIFSQMVDAWDTVTNENKSFKEKMKAVTGAVGNMVGVPAGNVWRDLEGILGLFKSPLVSGTSWRDIKYSALDETAPVLGKFEIWDDARGAYYGRIAQAMAAGDQETADELKGYLTETEGVKESSLKTGVNGAIKDMYLDGSIDAGMAAQMLEEMGKDENEAYFTVEEWMAVNENADNPDYSYSRYDEFYEAVSSGKNLKTVINELTSHGITKETLSGRITSQFKAEYIRLYKENKTAFANLQARLLTAYEALGYDRSKKMKDMQKWLKE